ncbi:MAG: hypothetical protein J5656_02485 [Clostridia bacterium]|nr:hypothetical protein [Clostridia bacterium]
MIDRFKRYLEREFRAIKPTKAAYELREEMLTQLLEKAQDLKIKGMTDDDLIYDMCIDSLGDVRQNLIDFENRSKKVKTAKRNVVLGLIISVAFVITIVAAYLITSFAIGNAWGKTWLILVGGIFFGAAAVSTLFGAILIKKKKYLIAQIFVDIDIVLLTVFVFLVLQILFGFSKSWLAFLVMPVILIGVLAVMLDLSGTKLKYLGYGAFVEIFCVMLYIILGITMGLWHPYWILCLVGIIIDIIGVGVLVGIRNAKKKKAEEAEIQEHDIDEDEEYYTMWKDR